MKGGTCDSYRTLRAFYTILRHPFLFPRAPALIRISREPVFSAEVINKGNSIQWEVETMLRKKVRKNEKELYDDIINGLSPEGLRGVAEGELSADEIVSTEEWKSLGNRINPEYSKLDEIVCVCSATSEVRWIERQLFFKLGSAVGRRQAKEPQADAVKGK